MTQADFTIANQTFPNTRTELNTSLQALATNSAGNSAPSTTFPNQWHFDSDGNVLYMRNKDNDAWVQILTIGATSDLQTITTDLISEVTSAAGVTVDGLLIKDSAVGASGTATSVAGIPFFSDTSNGSIYTHDVSGTDDTAQYNTAYGLTALDAITTGDYNVAIGYNAGSDTTTGERNTFIGNDAGKDCIGGGQNVAIGDNAGGGALSTAAGRNIMIGRNAGTSLTSGTNSIFVGFEAGDGHDAEDHNLGIGTSALGGSINGGEYNVAIGNYAGDGITSGDNNVVLGYNAGANITTADQCVAIGTGTLNGSGGTTGSSNVVIGHLAGNAVTTGGENVIIGHNAVASGAMTALYSVIIGKDAGKMKTSGSNCIFIGYQAGEQVTSGQNNIFIGSNAGDDFDTETNNIGIGAGSLGGSIAGGEYNVSLGHDTLDALTSGDYNVAVGHNAGSALNTGSTNTMIGVEAGLQLTSGGNNLLLGVEAGRGSSPRTVTNESNNIVLGNNSITDASIKVDWTVTSDKRDKADIEPLTMGLDFVNKLNPVTYRWDMRSDYENKTPDGTHKKAKLSGGLLAQDVEVLEREYGYKVEDETSILTTVNADGNYGLTYSKFVPILINAVKELSAEIKALKGE